MSSIINPSTDSLDHINIYSRAVTELGRFLSNFSHVPIEISIGKFNSIEGLIYFLGSFDESLRELSGSQAKIDGRALDRGIRLPNDVFRRLIKEAMVAKLESDHRMKQAFINSHLPFSHYYVSGGRPVGVPKWKWQIELWEEMRSMLQESLTI